ncbi:hypothetical protein OHT57_35635 [Streptomyces sp. NBC_00285]|uniref:hypothetical protein n=1 Tax=Streptomyces sp. NBC_00285 TaxID=2975700 RepID=UPI002E294279|nr:hypothetical protein [Streptomyces sp. NBC_00285]
MTSEALITHFEEGPDHDPDDPLTVLLRPPADYLGVPPGRYEAIRRGAARRKLLRAAAGAALTVGVGVLVVLPLRPSAPGTQRSPTIPMAPPTATAPASDSSASPPQSPASTERRPTGRASEATRPTPSATRSVPSDSSPSRPAASASTGGSATRAPSTEPSAGRTEG